MTDIEIKEYIQTHQGAVKAQDYIMEIRNTSPQIIESFYDLNSGKVTLYTPDNTFMFQLILNKIM